MVVVTGPTGHIGNVLVRELLKRGERVRALVLPSEDLTPIRGLDVEIVEGDIVDLDSLIRAFEGADVVYHLAGVISIVPGEWDRLYRVNVVGTRNVIRACLTCGLEGSFMQAPSMPSTNRLRVLLSMKPLPLTGEAEHGI